MVSCEQWKTNTTMFSSVIIEQYFIRFLSISLVKITNKSTDLDELQWSFLLMERLIIYLLATVTKWLLL